MQQGSGRTVFYAFDVLEADGERLVYAPLEAAEGAAVRAAAPPGQTVIVSEQFADGEALFDAVSAQGLEGVVAKRLASRYAEGRRTRDWLKLQGDRAARSS